LDVIALPPGEQCTRDPFADEDMDSFVTRWTIQIDMA
jgi:hypothetical protein